MERNEMWDELIADALDAKSWGAPINFFDFAKEKGIDLQYMFTALEEYEFEPEKSWREQ